MSKRRKNSNKTVFIIVGVVVLALIGFGFLAKSKGWIGKPKAKKVEFANAAKATIVEQVSASGKVEPVDEVKISSEVSGELKELYIEEGDSVQVGTSLAKIRPDNLVSILDRANANLNTQRANFAQSKARYSQSKARFIQSEQDYKRNEGLLADKVISEQEFQTAQANYEAAKADLEASEQSIEAAKFTVLSAEASVDEARKNLALTNIFSPMEGIVTNLDVEKGETVLGTQQNLGTEILRIANLNAMEVRVNVNENDIIRVSVGDTAIIDVDSYSYLGETFKGVVTAIANSANESLTTDVVTEFEVKILVLNDSYKHLITKENPSPFRPGMTASVDIITERKSNILTVPLAAVTTRNEKDLKKGEDGENGDERGSSRNQNNNQDDDIKEVIFVKSEEGTAKLVEVKTGISDFENIEILSGIEEGTEIVKGPFLQVSKNLKDGDAIEEITEEDKGKRGGRGDD